MHTKIDLEALCHERGLRITDQRRVIARVISDSEDHPDVGILGPQLRYGDGGVQSSRRRFPTLATFFLESTVLQKKWPRNRILDRYFVLDKPDDAISQVDWVVGACMLVRRAVLDALRGHWRVAILVGLLSPLSYILVLAALSDGAPLSLVAPMREMSMMNGALMAMAILRERVGIFRIAGCGAVIAGVTLLAS